MDPNPKTFPILSYVMSKLPSITSKSDSGSPGTDIEQPPSSLDLSTSMKPHFELTEQMPHLTDPKVLQSMRLAVGDVVQTRSMLQILGERPDHETVDNAKVMLVEIKARLSKQLEETVLSPRPEDVDRSQWRSRQAEKEEELRKAAEKEMQLYKAVIALDEMHEEYEKLLTTAEGKLEKIYQTAAAGGDSAMDNTVDTPEVDEGVCEEVIQVLEEVSRNGVETIDLSCRRLLFLPEAFGRVNNLRVFNLSSNQLKVIPDSISRLEMLEELNLSSNLLESLPDSIGLLLNLKILNVSGNKLTMLPDSICRCRSLVELDASFNKLTYLPTNIGYELVNLKRLSIPLNKIRALPTSIGEMRSLQLLDAHFNELRGLPPSVGRLTNLETLNLSSNFSDLTELPDTIGELINLKELDLSNNQIQVLPITFCRLNNLTKLNLEQNPMVFPPKNVVDLGVEAVKKHMEEEEKKRMEEEEKSKLESKRQTEAGWLTRSTSWLGNAVSGVTGTVSGYLGGGGKSNLDPILNEQL